MHARSVCLLTLSLSVVGPGRCGRQKSFTDIYHAIPWLLLPWTPIGENKNKSKAEYWSGVCVALFALACAEVGGGHW